MMVWHVPPFSPIGTVRAYSSEAGACMWMVCSGMVGLGVLGSIVRVMMLAEVGGYDSRVVHTNG